MGWEVEGENQQRVMNEEKKSGEEPALGICFSLVFCSSRESNIVRDNGRNKRGKAYMA